MSTSTLPHWLQVIMGVLVISVAAVLTANSNGQLVLPGVVIIVLTVTKTLLGLFTDSVKTVTLARRAARMRRDEGLHGYVTMRLLLPLAGGGFLFLGIGASCQVAAKDVTIGLDAAICVINTVSSDLAAGKTESDAFAHAGVTCGVTAAQAGGVFAAHRKAEVIEGKSK